MGTTMRFGKATAAGQGPKLPRPPRLPRVQPPRLHQPTVHVTAMVAVAALVSALAAAAPALRGSFVGGGTSARPAAVVAAQGGSANAASPAVTVPGPAGTPTFSTTVTPPPNTTIGTGPGNVSTILFSNPNSGTALASPLAGDGIPVTALEAYQDGANSANANDRNCHIPWPLLAGIGRVESDHGRYGGAILRPDGTSTKPIIGPPLNGAGTEVITDTDGGSVDGDPVYDRAVGPMQFIPSTWLIYGADGNGDGIKDPFNIFDAALAAANYLCAAGGNLSTTAGQTRAVLSYNHSTAYLNEVLSLEHTYASGNPGLVIPNAPVVLPPVPIQHPGGKPVPPPVNPGPPLGGPTPTHPTGGSGGSTHHPEPHPTSSAPGHRGGSSTSPGGGSSTSSDPSSSTGSDPSTGTTTTAPGDPSSTTSDPDPTDTTSTDPDTPTDSPTCPTSSSSDDPDGAASSSDATDLAVLAADSPSVEVRAAADSTETSADPSSTGTAGPGNQTADPSGCG